MIIMLHLSDLKLIVVVVGPELTGVVAPAVAGIRVAAQSAQNGI